MNIISKQKIAHIIHLHVDGWTLAEISERVAVSLPTVHKYVRMFRSPKLCKQLPV